MLMKLRNRDNKHKTNICMMDIDIDRISFRAMKKVSSSSLTIILYFSPLKMLCFVES